MTGLCSALIPRSAPAPHALQARIGVRASRGTRAAPVAVGWAKARAKDSALATRRFAAPCPRAKLHRGIPLGQSRRLGKRTAIRVGTARAIKPAQPACTHRRAPLPTLRESGGEVALPAAAEHLDV